MQGDGITHDRSIRVMLAILTTIAVVAALHFTRPIFIPIAFSIFIVAIVWPLQSGLQRRLPTLVSLAITISVTAIVITTLLFLAVWGFGVVGQWLFRNTARFQESYAAVIRSLDGHGIRAADFIAEYFDVRWITRTFQQVTGRLHGTVTFVLVTLVFSVAGAVGSAGRQEKAGSPSRPGIGAIAGTRVHPHCRAIPQYMLVRTGMSLLTGIAIWVFLLFAGLELATAWGVIAFALNYIPFVGPFIATLFPSIFAIVQLESWQGALLIFMGLNLIQFLIGSYLEPRIAGAALSMSPFLVLFSVFFWMFIWGIPGAFIGVPIMIALLTICAQSEIQPLDCRTPVWRAGREKIARSGLFHRHRRCRSAHGNSLRMRHTEP